MCLDCTMVTEHWDVWTISQCDKATYHPLKLEEIIGKNVFLSYAPSKYYMCKSLNSDTCRP